jgi:Spy/CpxP family protein refolding chaperone
MKRGIIIGGLVAGVVLAVATVGVAQPRHPRHMFERIAEKLDLDAETEAAVEAIVEETRPQGRALHDELREAHHALRELMSQDTPDEADVMAQAESLGELETEARKHHLATLLRIRALLTPEQRAELVEMRHKHRAGVLERCEADVKALCPETDEEDVRRTLRCLHRNAEDLSDECREALPRRRHGRGFGRF